MKHNGQVQALTPTTVNALATKAYVDAGGGSGSVVVYSHNGSTYVTSTARLFFGPEDPVADGYSGGTTDLWIDPTAPGGGGPLLIDSRTANFTLTTASPGRMQMFTGASALTLSIPTNATAAIPIGSVVPLLQRGTGRVTVEAVTPGTTTVLFPPVGTNTVTRGQGSMVALTKVETDTWVASGDLTAP